MAKRETELLPNDASTLDTLGWVQYARGAYTETEPLFRKAAELAGDSAPIQYHLGMTYYRVGRKDDAVFALRRALQLDPKLPAAARIHEHADNPRLGIIASAAFTAQLGHGLRRGPPYRRSRTISCTSCRKS